MTDLNIINEALAQFAPFETDIEMQILGKAISELIQDKRNLSLGQITKELNKARDLADQALAKEKAKEEELRKEQLEAEAKERFELEVKEKIRTTNPLFCKFGVDITTVLKNGMFVEQYIDQADWIGDDTYKTTPGSIVSLRWLSNLNDYGAWKTYLRDVDDAEEIISVFGIPYLEINNSRYDGNWDRYSVVAIWPNGSFLARDKTGETSSEWKIVSDFDEALQVGLNAYWKDEANCAQDIDEALAKIVNAN